MNKIFFSISFIAIAAVCFSNNNKAVKPGISIALSDTLKPVKKPLIDDKTTVSNQQIKDAAATSDRSLMVKPVKYWDGVAIYNSITNTGLAPFTLTEPTTISFSNLKNLQLKGRCKENAIVLINVEISYRDENESMKNMLRLTDIVCYSNTQAGEWKASLDGKVPASATNIAVKVLIRGYVNSETIKMKTPNVSRYLFTVKYPVSNPQLGPRIKDTILKKPLKRIVN